MRRTQADDRAVLVIEPLAPLVAMRQLQALLPPKAFHFLVVYVPAFDTQQLGDLAVFIATVRKRPATPLLSRAERIATAATRRYD